MQHVAQRGWSLVELLTVLAVSAILVTVAVPSLSAAFYELLVRSAAHEFAAWMTLARSEAIKRGLVEVGEHEMRAKPAQQRGGGARDATGGAGQQRHLAGQLEHGGRSFLNRRPSA